MLGSNSPRMSSIALPHVHEWNVWWDIYGNTPEGFAAVVSDMRDRTVAAGRNPAEVEATACVYVQLPEGSGRTMAEQRGAVVPAVRGSVAEMAEQLAAFARVGASHLQLVVDPITIDAISTLGPVADRVRALV